MKNITEHQLWIKDHVKPKTNRFILKSETIREWTMEDSEEIPSGTLEVSFIDTTTGKDVYCSFDYDFGVVSVSFVSVFDPEFDSFEGFIAEYETFAAARKSMYREALYKMCSLITEKFNCYIW